MKPLEIIFVSSEAVPYSKTGGLADVAGGLPQAIAKTGHNVSVFLPLYRATKEGKFNLKTNDKKLLVSLSNKSFAFELSEKKLGKVNIYFIKQDEFFDRDYLYATPFGDYPDNALRFAFYSKAVLESIVRLKKYPDLIHCNEWQTALIPFYIKHGRTSPSGVKTLFTMHNLMYQGNFPKETVLELGIEDKFFNHQNLEFYGKLSFIKSGIIYSDVLNAVSKGYAREILTKKFGCGLEGILKKRKADLYGIINGVDYSKWNPEIDPLIKANYGPKSINRKDKCKEDLLRQVGSKGDFKGPLLGNISRLVANKGVDNILKAVPLIKKLDCKLILLGFGDGHYNDLFQNLAKEHPRHVFVTIGFDEKLAHKIEAGCDIFLMPSHYEPCGLNQLYSLKYGTIPVVGAVGGLDDTIVDYTKNPQTGNGFKYNKIGQVGFEDALKRAASLYKDKKSWKLLINRAMKMDFSWQQSAKEYIKLYRRVIAG
jgi:starch synthase